MKRSELPRRKKPLARGKPPRRSSSMTRTVTSQRRRSIPNESTKHREERVDHPEIRRAVFDRDGWRCVLMVYRRDPDFAQVYRVIGDCYGPLTPHHVRKAAQGGKYELSNLVTLCAAHNDRLEADADLAALARSIGLVKKRGD